VAVVTAVHLSSAAGAVAAERRSMEHKLHQAERLQSLGQLAGGIAHDFNNLLAAIMNYAGFVAEQITDRSAVRADAEQIHAAAERAARLTRQLLIFSRRQETKPETLDPNAIVGFAVRPPTRSRHALDPAGPYRHALYSPSVSKGLLRGPVSGRWLDDAEFIAVGIGENMPAPSELLDRLAGKQESADALDTPDLGVKVWRAQVEVKAVLVSLLIRHPLQQDLHALTVCWNQALIGAHGGALRDVPEHPGPEVRGAAKVGAVDHDDQLAPLILLRFAAHNPMLPAM
jgi:hypothetical protein